MFETLFGPHSNFHCAAHNGIVEADESHSGLDDTAIPP